MQLRKDSLKKFRLARSQTCFPLMWGNVAVVELLAVVLSCKIKRKNKNLVDCVCTFRRKVKENIMF